MPRKRPERPVLLRAVTKDGQLQVVAITSYRLLPNGIDIQEARTHDVTQEFLALAAEVFPGLIEGGILKPAVPAQEETG